MPISIPQFSQSEIDRINNVCLNLSNSKQQLDIINWLANFEKHEWGNALTVSEKIKYFSVIEIISELDGFLKKILIKYPDKKLHLSFLGEFGKSGSHLIYYIKKTPSFKTNEENIKILDNLRAIKNILRQDDVLLLVDDIIGTGESTIKFYNHMIKQQLVSKRIEINVVLLCVAYMYDSIKLITKNIKNFEIYGTPYKKAFISSGSVFGYRKKMIPIKNFCNNYGEGLFTLQDKITRVNVDHPLGYGQSQSLIVFEHSAPNNTLPIIWSSKNSWTPLYPRNIENRISAFKDFRNNNIIWFNLAKELGIISGGEDFKSQNFKDLNFRLLALIRLKMKKMDDMAICQKMKVTINGLDEIYNDGKILGDFNENNELTEKGIRNYNLILEKRHQQKIKIVSLKDKGIYIPEIFSNRS